MTASSLGRRTLWCLDVLSLLALFGTGEVNPQFFAVLAVAVGLRLLRVRIGARWALLSCIVAALGCAVFATLHYRYHPLLSAAHVAIVVHALLWLGPENVRDRVLRLAMSFINVVLAAALTTDFYLFPMILLVFVITSIYIATAFLEAKFLEQYPERREVDIPPGFLKNMIGVSLAVFVVSLALFPLLPRSTWRQNSDDAGFSSIGYRNNVEVTPSAAANALHKTYRPALSITSLRADAPDPGSVMPLHLLRGSDLELFDGSRWVPRSSKLRAARSTTRGGRGDYEIAVQPHLRNQLLLPYTGRITQVSDSEHYQLALDSGYRSPNASEPPLELHVRVPAELRSSKLLPLAQKIFRNATTPSQKVQALLRFYSTGFRGSLEPQPAAADTSGVISNFLLNEQKGSCELFSTSAALLLRLANVPTRLVAGYRVTRYASQGVLTILDSDAHAWVEFWEPSRGWTPFDPTPLVLVESGWFDSVRESYWSASVFWDRWILGYGKANGFGSTLNASARTLSETLKASTGFMENISGKVVTDNAGVILMLALATGGSIFGGLWVFRIRRFAGNRVLRREYLRMIKLSRGRTLDTAAAAVFLTWQQEYQRLRFGAESETPKAHDTRELKRLRLELGAQLEVKRL